MNVFDDKIIKKFFAKWHNNMTRRTEIRLFAHAKELGIERSAHNTALRIRPYLHTVLKGLRIEKQFFLLFFYSVAGEGVAPSPTPQCCSY